MKLAKVTLMLGASAAVVAMAIGWLAPCTASAQAAPGASPVDEPVLKIGERTVRRSEIRNELGFEPPELVTRMREDENFAKIYAIRWYQAELFAKAAADDGVAARVPGLSGAARNLGRNLIADEYTKQMIEVEFKPTDTEIETYYNLHKDVCVTPRRLHLARLGVQVAKNASEEETAGAKKRLAKMQERIAAGEAFSVVADEMSDLPSKEQGGDVGWIGEQELGDEEGSTAIRSLAVGATSEPIRTRRGWEIFKLIEKDGPKTRTLAECRDDIVAQINAEYRKAASQRRSDELARRYDASLNLDAFLAAIAEAKVPDVAPDGRRVTGSN
jgi:PPIC-type PPIASE domain